MENLLATQAAIRPMKQRFRGFLPVAVDVETGGFDWNRHALLVSWTLGRWPLLVSAAGLIVLETVMLAVHAVQLDAGLALTNLALLAITVPVLLGRRAPR